MALEGLVAIYGYADAVAGFVGNAKSLGSLLGVLKSTLQEVGMAHYRAAIAAIDDAAVGDDPKRDYESAITLLRSAYELERNAERKCQTALLLATCFRSLEDHRLTARYLQKAYVHYNEMVTGAKATPLMRDADSPAPNPFSIALRARMVEALKAARPEILKTARRIATGVPSATCESCKGTGKCEACGGRGRHEVHAVTKGFAWFAAMFTGEVPDFSCAACDTSGKCVQCHGNGNPPWFVASAT